MSDVIESARQHVQAATLASLEGDLERALAELIIASEQFVDGMQHVKNKEERKKLLNQFDECAEEAERLKARQKLAFQPQADPTPRVDKQKQVSSLNRGPVPCLNFNTEELRQPTKKEQMILLTSSKIDDRVFPVWNDANIASHLAITEPYTDTTTLFSTTKEFVKSYERLSTWAAELTMSDADMILYTSLAQKLINDCSLVSSLIVASQWTSRFRTRLLTCSLYPQDDSTEPTLSPHGKYMMKVELNGTTRQVVVDDFVPMSDNSDLRDILVFSTNYPNIIWPAIVEKIFLKVNGPDFEGSNSASDLRLLTGWLPEEVTFRHTKHSSDLLWSRIHHSWIHGEVLITLGSGKLTVAEEEEYGLIAEHSYAVTGLQETAEGKFMTIQNPWLGASGTQYTKIIFEMDLTQVFYRFATMFLNWHPRIWPHKATLHAQIKESQFSITTHNVSQCPQYLLSNHSDSAIPIYLLLTRHKSTSTSRKVYSSLAVYDVAGERVLADSVAIAKTDYHASHEVSLQFSLPAGSQYTIVLSQQDPLPKESITIIAYSKSASIRLNMAPDSSVHEYIETSEWTSESAGGPSPVPTFSRNPWYKLTTTRETRLTVALESGAAHSIGFAVTYSHSKPLTLTSKNMVRDSSLPGSSAAAAAATAVVGVKYAPSCMSSNMILKPGHYAITCTTSRPNQLGGFKLTVWSDVEVSVVAGKSVGAGKFMQLRKWHWTKSLLAQRFHVSSERMNLVTVHLHGPRTATVTLEMVESCESTAGVRGDVNVLGKAEGQGSVALDSLVLLRNRTYSLICRIAECHIDAEFEVQVYSASVLELNRC